jgi:hypothetical protein
MDLIDSAVKSLRSLANERRDRYLELIFFSFPFFHFFLAFCLFFRFAFIYLFILIMDRIFFLLPNHIGTCSFLLDKYNSNGREREGQSHRTNQSQLVKMSKSKNSGCI